MNGESMRMAGRLLNHRRAPTTDRYAHLDDAALSPAHRDTLYPSHSARSASTTRTIASVSRRQ